MIWAALAFLVFFAACLIFSAVGLWWMGPAE
ncbi:hypothetical protein ACVWWD_004240 [Mesorhizobium sp. URHB0026]